MGTGVDKNSNNSFVRETLETASTYSSSRHVPARLCSGLVIHSYLHIKPPNVLDDEELHVFATLSLTDDVEKLFTGTLLYNLYTVY